MDYKRGSEWRRWDLHVHTKGTKKADNFKSKDFDEFCVALFEKALENQIAAIGITDYFSIDNYKRVVQFVDMIDQVARFSNTEKSRIRQILLIPNVELRMVPVTDSGRMINIHCLFNPDFVNSLDNHFFGSLEHAGGEGKTYKMNRDGLIDLGRSTNPSLGEDEACQVPNF